MLICPVIIGIDPLAPHPLESFNLILINTPWTVTNYLLCFLSLFHNVEILKSPHKNPNP